MRQVTTEFIGSLALLYVLICIASNVHEMLIMW